MFCLAEVKETEASKWQAALYQQIFLHFHGNNIYLLSTWVDDNNDGDDCQPSIKAIRHSPVEAAPEWEWLREIRRAMFRSTGGLAIEY